MIGSRSLSSLLQRTLHVFSARGARFLGAAVAFYALMSAAPLFVIVLGLAGTFLGGARAESALFDGLARWVAPEGVATARALTDRLARAEHAGGALDVALVVYGSTRLFRALGRAVNQLFGVDLEAIEGARDRTYRYAARYGQALALTGAVAAMVGWLVAVKSGYALLAALGAPSPPLLLSLVDLATSIALTFALFLLMLRVLPKTRVAWRTAAAGAAVSTVLFAAGSGVVTAYLRRKHTGDLYEGATAVVVAVLWVYYSAQVFFLGVCFAAVMHESPTPPSAADAG